MENHEINNTSLVNISLYKEQWTVIVQWMSKFPFEEAIKLTNKVAEEVTGNTEAGDNDIITMKLSIQECDQIMFSIRLAPYYLVESQIHEIFNQGLGEVEKLKKEANEKKITEEVKSNETLTPKKTVKRTRGKKNVKTADL